jgi:hypothetical protein
MDVPIVACACVAGMFLPTRYLAMGIHVTISSCLLDLEHNPYLSVSERADERKFAGEVIRHFIARGERTYISIVIVQQYLEVCLEAG